MAIPVERPVATSTADASAMEQPLSPLGAAIAASPQFAAFAAAHAGPPTAAGKSHPLLDALATFLASPAGQALEAALINMILSALTPKAA